MSSFFTEVWGDGIIGVIGSYTLWTTDVAVLVSIPMLALAIFSPSRGIGYAQLFLLGWLAVAGFWLLRAIAISPFEATHGFRPYAAYCIALLAFCFRPVSPDVYRKIGQAFIWTALALAALVLLRLVFGSTLFVHATSGGLWAYAVDGRPIQAAAALIIGEAAIFALALRQAGAASDAPSIKWNLLIGIVLLIALLACGQRTTAAATAAGLTILIVGKSTGRFGGLFNPVTLFGGLTLIVIAVALTPADLMSILPEKFTAGNALKDFDLRMQIWASIILHFESWSLFEEIFGKADTWTLFWYVVRNGSVIADVKSAHNVLFGIVLFTGALGVLLIVSAVAACIAGAARASKRMDARNISGLPPPLILSLLSILMIFGVSYQWQYEQGIVLGLCAAQWPYRKRAAGFR